MWLAVELGSECWIVVVKCQLSRHEANVEQGCGDYIVSGGSTGIKLVVGSK